MFSGIVRDIGVVKKIEQQDMSRTFEIQTSLIQNEEFASRFYIGASIAINGACHTITRLTDSTFFVQSVSETLKLTNLSLLQVDDEVNLEPSLRLIDTVDGHLVSGHVDAVCDVSDFKKNSGSTYLKVIVPSNLLPFIVKKGSITIDGVSLTVTEVDEESFSVTLIDHTLEVTTLKNIQAGSKVNIEVDIIARYIAKAHNLDS